MAAKCYFIICTFLCISSNCSIAIFECSSGLAKDTQYCVPTDKSGVLKKDLPLSLRAAKVVYLNNSGIREIKHDAFYSIRYVEKLHLNNNELTAVNPEWFLNLRNLQRIDLSGNQITEIDPDMFALSPNIREIVLARNQIKSYKGKFDYSNAFIDLSWNPLIDIQIGAVRTLQLSHTDLEELHLTHGVVNVLALNSKIKKFSIKDGTQPPLEQLFLGGNNITDLDIISAFPASLRYLDLSKNPLGTVNAASFLNLPNLYHLNLSDTLMLRMHYGMFANQKDLKVLDISNNYLSYLYTNKIYPASLNELYLQNNQIYKVVDKDKTLRSLKVLAIAGNQLYCETLFQIYIEGTAHGMHIFTPANLINNVDDNIAGMKCIESLE